MMMIRLTFFIVVFATLPLLSGADDPCRFQHTRGIIDLTSIGRTDGRPAYPDKIPPTGSSYKYSYNPCKPFTEGTSCQNVAACQVSLDGLFTYAIGMQDTASWNPGGLGGSPTVSYTNGQKNVQVTLECSRSGAQEFEALGESPENTYRFRLVHLCACWDGCGSGPQPTTTQSPSPSPSGGGTGGIGGGAVFIILLLVLAFVYFVGFAAFYRFRHQRSGTELIAHRTFWVGLPGYAKDGAVYVYRRVANKGGDPYQSV